VTLPIELEREDDGRWLAEVPLLAGVMCYGADRDEAVARVQALALRVLAERLEYREAPAEFLNVTFEAAWATGRPQKARRVLAALLKIGWQLKRQSGSHRSLTRPNWPDVVFAFHDDEEIGPKMMARIAKRTGLTPDDL
jgi:predicted RNA binding protein YcfA (HicA-like mRNA interferase family)/predicted RNase H-like HicB family nuclease